MACSGAIIEYQAHGIVLAVGASLASALRWVSSQYAMSKEEIGIAEPVSTNMRLWIEVFFMSMLSSSGYITWALASIDRTCLRCDAADGFVPIDSFATSGGALACATHFTILLLPIEHRMHFGDVRWRRSNCLRSGKC